MNILVTGGAGFIGSHFVDKLCRDGYKPKVLDKLTYAGNMKNLSFSEPPTCVCDIADPEIEGIIEVENIDTIVNFAAETHVDRSISDPKAFINTDIVGLINLVHACVKKNIKRFIHISTDEVYGSISNGAFTEGQKLNPTSPYSASKASADLLLMSFYKTYGLPVILVRPSNNYGVRQYPEKLIPMTILRLLNGENAIMHGEGQEVREWLHVDDCVDGVYNVMTRGKVGETYNLGSGVRINNHLIIDLILNIMGLNHDRIEKVNNRPGNDYRYAIDSIKAYQDIDFSPHRTLVEELEPIIEWYDSNRDYWHNVDISANIYTDNKEYLR